MGHSAGDELEDLDGDEGDLDGDDLEGDESDLDGEDLEGDEGDLDGEPELARPEPVQRQPAPPRFRAPPPHAPPPRAWPIVLLDGREVSGPFNRTTNGGGPMVEIWTAVEERDRPTAAPTLTKGGFVGRLPWNSDPDDIRSEWGDGAWFVVVRGAKGQILAGGGVRTGAPPPPPRPGPPQQAGRSERVELPEWAVELKRQAEESRLQVERMRQAEHERLERENQELRKELLRDRRAASAAIVTGGGPVDPVDALTASLEKVKRLREMFSSLEPEGQGEQGLLDEISGEFERLVGMAENAGKLSGMVDGDDASGEDGADE